MSNTGIYQGLQGEKSTSRVLQPPGGGSSNIFGTNEVQTQQFGHRGVAPPSNNIFGAVSPVQQTAKPKENTANNIFGGPDEKQELPAANAKIDEDEVTDPVPQADEGPSASQSAQANARRMQQGINPITGEEVGAQYQSSLGSGEPKPPIGAGNPITGAAANDQPAPVARVRQPPGGASNRLW